MMLIRFLPLLMVNDFLIQTLLSGSGAKALLEADSQNGQGTTGTLAIGTALVNGSSLMSAQISNASVENVQAIVVLSMSSTAVLTTWSFLRDGVVLGTFTTPAGVGMTKFLLLDLNAPAGTRTYSVQPNQSTGSAAGEMFLMNSDAAEGHAISPGANSLTFAISSGIALNITTNITLNAIGTVIVEIFEASGAGTLTLKRDGNTLTTFTTAPSLSRFSFTDSNVPVGAHAYALTSSISGSIMCLMACISNGG